LWILQTNEIAQEFGESSLRDEELDIFECNRVGEIENVDTVDAQLHEEGISYIGNDGNVEGTSAAINDRINEEASLMSDENFCEGNKCL
jgi:hypothetical protein